MSTGSDPTSGAPATPAPVVTPPDFTAFQAAVAKLVADVTAQATLEANYETCEAALGSANTDLSAANDARQAGLQQLSADNSALVAAAAALVTPPADPHATAAVVAQAQS
jgi:hypothetical protein